jgi:hypothetical protein
MPEKVISAMSHLHLTYLTPITAEFLLIFLLINSPKWRTIARPPWTINKEVAFITHIQSSIVLWKPLKRTFTPINRLNNRVTTKI